MPIIRTPQGRVVTDEVCNNTGFIYVMADGGGKYKIGYSGQPKERLQTVKSKLKNAATKLLHTFHTDNTEAAELELHDRYDHLRVSKGSEWFNLSGDDVVYLQTIVRYEDGEFIYNE